MIATLRRLAHDGAREERLLRELSAVRAELVRTQEREQEALTVIQGLVTAADRLPARSPTLQAAQAAGRALLGRGR